MQDDNMAERESRILLERWSDSEHLKDSHDYQIKKMVAVLLENQRLMNELSESCDQEQSAKLIPLVRAVYPNLLVCKIASCQPILGPNGLVYHHDVVNKFINSEEIASRTKKLDLNFGLDFGVKDRAVDIINEIDKEVLEDLSNNCGTVGSVNLSVVHHPLANLREVIAGAFEYFKYRNPARRPVNWMVVNDKIFASYEEAFSWKDVKVYVNKNIKGILYGHKGDLLENYDDIGYVYAPYVPFTYTPLREDGRFSLITRYGKKLLRNGSDYYGKITII